MSSFKIVVTGAFNSGKTQFIKTLSDIPVVSTEKRISTGDSGVKAETTVAMDYGRFMLDDDTLFLYGTPGQARFDFMWEILSGKMDGYIVMVDSTDEHSFADAAAIIADFEQRAEVPHLVVANKTDIKGSFRLADIRREVNVRPDITVMPCVATQKSSGRQVLLQMVDLIRRSNSTE